MSKKNIPLFRVTYIRTSWHKLIYYRNVNIVHVSFRCLSYNANKIRPCTKPSSNKPRPKPKPSRTLWKSSWSKLAQMKWTWTCSRSDMRLLKVAALTQRRSRRHTQICMRSLSDPPKHAAFPWHEKSPCKTAATVQEQPPPPTNQPGAGKTYYKCPPPILSRKDG